MNIFSGKRLHTKLHIHMHHVTVAVCPRLEAISRPLEQKTLPKMHSAARERLHSSFVALDRSVKLELNSRGCSADPLCCLECQAGYDALTVKTKDCNACADSSTSANTPAKSTDDETTTQENRKTCDHCSSLFTSRTSSFRQLRTDPKCSLLAGIPRRRDHQKGSHLRSFPVSCSLCGALLGGPFAPFQF
jgi:hypothetical protein